MNNERLGGFVVCVIFCLAVLAGLFVAGRFFLYQDWPIHAILVGIFSYGVICSVVIFNLDQHHYDRFGSANFITLLRGTINAWLINVLVAWSFIPSSAYTEWLFITFALLSFFLDGLDGFLARRENLSSSFGARFDIEIDGLLMTILAIAAWMSGLSVVVLCVAGLHYGFMILKVFLPWMRRDLFPSFRRKSGCVIQIAVLLIAVIPVIPIETRGFLIIAGFLFLLYSYSVDIIWLYENKTIN